MGLWQSEKDSNRQGFIGLWASSDELNPVFKIPLITSPASVPSGLVSTFARNSTATYIDKDGILQTAGINVPRFQNGRYLCEPAATNRFLQSGAPATQAITVVSGTVYTVQCYGSGSITLSGAGTGSVVEGAPVTFTASSTSLTCTVSGSLNRSQVETGTKATSYIPTTSAPVTRAADSLHYTVGSDITQGQGSLYCEFVSSISAISSIVLSLSDNTYNNRMYIFISDTQQIRLVGSVGGASTLNIDTEITNNESLKKILICYDDNNVSLYIDGALAGTDTSHIIPTNYSKLSIGCSHVNTYQRRSEIGNIKYFKEVLTSAEAIKITTL